MAHHQLPFRGIMNEGDTMQEMNPYYARESNVGAVFDVATPKKLAALDIGVMTCVVLAALLAAAVALLLQVEWFDRHLPVAFDDLFLEVRRGWRDHAIWMWVGTGVGAFVAYFLACAAISTFVLPFQGEFYLRSGPGGVSIRAPMGLAGAVPWCRILEADLPWSSIERWKITQRKQLGSISPNAGNLDADLTIWTHDGNHYCVPLGHFREPARLIFDRIEQAQEWVPMNLVSDEGEREFEPAS